MTNPVDRKLRVGVIFGGRSGEHEVSLVSATSVINALDTAKYDVVPIGITKGGRWISSRESLQRLKSKEGLEREPERFLVPEPNRQSLVSLSGERYAEMKLDVVFPVVHGTFGEDGTLQGLLELANIPYVGAGVLASAVGMDKIVQKQLHKQAGLPVVKYVWFLSSNCRENPKKVAAAVEKTLRYPVFVKPANTGSSVGISKAYGRKELQVAVELAAEFDRKVICEQGVRNAREIEVSVLGNDEPIASVPGEIIPSNEFYDYDAKYVDGKSRADIPAKMPKEIARRLRRLAVNAFTVLDCAGMARVDFFVTKKTNNIYLNEINTIPGFTAISMYPKLWEASGISYSQLLDRLIQLALDRYKEKSKSRTSYRPREEWYIS
ncbi:MAG: D-alanine--D-alanine ligase [Phycisphaeraceae bacterium]|nr:D-alanine--D-alanine ligase [Bacteroidota bacterium]MCW5768111.1 D-alanine--D-alanine ligase [Phycisphaeraceae bacterium]